VAGIAAAAGDNGKGVAGVAYGAKLLPLRVIGACGGWLSDTVDAVTWAAGGKVSGVPSNPSPARVINMSLGAEAVCQASMQLAIDSAVQQGSVIIAAAGNESQPAANVSPANCKNVITVGATSRAGNSATYSNYGPEVDVSAPGGDGSTGSENILSTVNSGTTTPAGEAYGYMQGTSMSAPHVAGVAALMLAVNPALSPAQIEQTVRDTARPLPGTCDGGCGTGIVDANAAVTRVAGVAFKPSIRSEADVVAADSSGTLWNYPSDGQGGFLSRVKIGGGWSSLKNGFVADWNQDGVLDLIAQWKDGRLMHYAGKYEGGFNPAQTIGTGWGDYFVTVGKWRTGDAYPGIVAYDANGALWHYPNASGGALSPRTGIGSGWKGLYLTMTDFDGDSRMDILAKKSDGNLVQYRSDGAGRFLSEPRKTIGTGWGIIDSITNLPGFNGIAQQGLMTRLTDGRLAYYPFTNGTWGSRTIEGSGWSAYNLFR
jgi:serine protease